MAGAHISEQALQATRLRWGRPKKSCNSNRLATKVMASPAVLVATKQRISETVETGSMRKALPTRKRIQRRFS